MQRTECTHIKHSRDLLLSAQCFGILIQLFSLADLYSLLDVDHDGALHRHEISTFVRMAISAQGIAELQASKIGAQYATWFLYHMHMFTVVIFLHRSFARRAGSRRVSAQARRDAVALTI